jgi:MoxR-like ATPase
VDRFMMKVLLGYPTEEEEFVIAQRALAAPVQVLPVATTAQLSALQAECRSVYVDPSLLQYAVKLVAATRAPAQHGGRTLRSSLPAAPARAPPSAWPKARRPWPCCAGAPTCCPKT